MSIPENILRGIDRLEPLPATVQKLILSLDDEDADFNEIATIIEFDKAITANILRVANSAAFGGRVAIHHARDAVVRLGTTTLLDILLIGHFRSLRVTPSRYLSEDELWLHGAAASLAVKAASRETAGQEIPQAATIAALVHDIGKLVMVRYMDADPGEIARLSGECAIPMLEAERKVLGCDHAEVGGLMARKWGFPEQIAQAIALHHHESIEEPCPVMDAVLLANLVARSLQPGEDGSRPQMSPVVSGAAWRLGIDAARYERVCHKTALWLDDLRDSFGFAG